MKILAIVLLLAAIACGGGSGWLPPNRMEPVPGMTEERVVDRQPYLDIEEVPNQFRHLGEDPIAGKVYFLFSEQGHACMVDAIDFVMAQNGENWPCKWRIPRGMD